MNVAEATLLVITIASVAIALYATRSVWEQQARLRVLSQKPQPPPDPIATRGSRNLQAPSPIRVELGFAESYTADEFERIKRGVIDHAMEDKWFIFYEAPWLYFYRSWVGVCFYGLRFQSTDAGASVVESWTCFETEPRTKIRTDHHCAVLKYVIDVVLLGKPASYPVPSGAD